MLKSNRMQVSLIFLTNKFSISAFGKENLKPVYHFLSKKKSWKMSVAWKCRGGSNESMLLHKGWRVGLEHGRDVAPLALTTQGTRVGSARCTAAWICWHETSTALVWTTSHCSLSAGVCPSSFLVQNTQESPAQLQSCAGRGLSSHLYLNRLDKGFGVSWQETSRQQFWEQPLLLLV